MAFTTTSSEAVLMPSLTYARMFAGYSQVMHKRIHKEGANSFKMFHALAKIISNFSAGNGCLAEWFRHTKRPIPKTSSCVSSTHALKSH
jgi:hypothetical protein